MRNEGGGFAANIYGAMPESHMQVTSHSRFLILNFCFQTFGNTLFPYRHPERSRGIFLALRSVSHRHWQGNDALVLRVSAFTHASFISLQERFLAMLEMTTQESDVSQSPSLIPSHQSLVTNPLLFRRRDDIRIEQTFGEVAVAHGDFREGEVLHEAIQDDDAGHDDVGAGWQEAFHMTLVIVGHFR